MVFKQVWHLFTLIFSDLGIYFLVFSWVAEAKIDWQLPVPVFLSLIVWLEAITFINLYGSLALIDETLQVHGV